jgi:predicted nucleotidyltransferase
METTKIKLPKNAEIFFENLRELLQTKLYFFGSVQRNDYFPGSSDIDVDIFTDNIPSTISKMQHFLHINRRKFKKLVWRMHNHDRTFARGHKVMYKSPDGTFVTEFSIYDEKFKKEILEEHNRKKELPFYASWALILLKFFYYKLNLLDDDIFNYIKKLIMSSMLGLPQDEFVVVDSKTHRVKNFDYDVLQRA